MVSGAVIGRLAHLRTTLPIMTEMAGEHRGDSQPDVGCSLARNRVYAKCVQGKESPTTWSCTDGAETVFQETTAQNG